MQLLHYFIFFLLCGFSVLSYTASLQCNEEQYAWPLDKPKHCCDKCPPGTTSLFSPNWVSFWCRQEFNHQILLCALGHKMKRSRNQRTCGIECIQCEGERFSDNYNVDLSCKVCEVCNKREYIYTFKRTQDVSATSVKMYDLKNCTPKWYFSLLYNCQEHILKKENWTVRGNYSSVYLKKKSRIRNLWHGIFPTMKQLSTISFSCMLDILLSNCCAPPTDTFFFYFLHLFCAYKLWSNNMHQIRDLDFICFTVGLIWA